MLALALANLMGFVFVNVGSLLKFGSARWGLLRAGGVRVHDGQLPSMQGHVGMCTWWCARHIKLLIMGFGPTPSRSWT